MNSPLLRYLLLAGVFIFCAMAAAHATGLKVPLLFVYYDTPYYAYQDRIISFCLLTYACLFYLAARHSLAVPTALCALAITVLGLSAVNFSEALSAVLDKQGTGVYWAQTGVFAVYFVLLLVVWRRDRAAT